MGTAGVGEKAKGTEEGKEAGWVKEGRWCLREQGVERETTPCPGLPPSVATLTWGWRGREVLRARKEREHKRPSSRGNEGL